MVKRMLAIFTTALALLTHRVDCRVRGRGKGDDSRIVSGRRVGVRIRKGAGGGIGTGRGN